MSYIAKVQSEGQRVWCHAPLLDEEDCKLLRYRQIARATKIWKIADEIRSMFPEFSFIDEPNGFTVELR